MCFDRQTILIGVIGSFAGRVSIAFTPDPSTSCSLPLAAGLKLQPWPITQEFLLLINLKAILCHISYKIILKINPTNTAITNTIMTKAIIIFRLKILASMVNSGIAIPAPLPT